MKEEDFFHTRRERERERVKKVVKVFWKKILNN